MNIIQNPPHYFKKNNEYWVRQSVTIKDHYYYFTSVRALVEDAVDTPVSISSDSKTLVWNDKLITPKSRAAKFTSEDLEFIFKDCVYDKPTTRSDKTNHLLLNIGD